MSDLSIEMYDLPRARNTDPATSHAAADRATNFAGSHAERILAALKAVGTGTPASISEITGLTIVQIDRRLHELEKKGLIRIVKVFGHDLVIGGYRCWEPVR
jgi:predicted transcriptional regulator